MTVNTSLKRVSKSEVNIVALATPLKAVTTTSTNSRKSRSRSSSALINTIRPLNSPQLVKHRSVRCRQQAHQVCELDEKQSEYESQGTDDEHVISAAVIPILQYGSISVTPVKPSSALSDIYSPIASVKKSTHKQTVKSVAAACDNDARLDVMSSSYKYIHPVFDADEFDPFQFIKSLPPLHTVHQPRSRLPVKSSHCQHHNTLVIDLDETLVHCSIQPLDTYDHVFDVLFGGVTYTVYMRCRPYMMHFIQTVSQWYEIVIFTASQGLYADKLLDIIDPKKEFIQHRLFREHCVCIDSNYVKDLTVLNRPMQSVLMLDNSVQAFGYQVDNGLPIESWFDSQYDTELLNLLPLLHQLKDVKTDVRPLIRQLFQIQKLVDNAPD